MLAKKQTTLTPAMALDQGDPEANAALVDFLEQRLEAVENGTDTPRPYSMDAVIAKAKAHLQTA